MIYYLLIALVLFLVTLFAVAKLNPKYGLYDKDDPEAVIRIAAITSLAWPVVYTLVPMVFVLYWILDAAYKYAVKLLRWME